MWKQWELEQGLTMMVSDDVILSRLNKSKKHHQCSKHRNKSKSPSRESERVFKGSYAAGSSKSDVDRYFGLSAFQTILKYQNILFDLKYKTGLARSKQNVFNQLMFF